MSSDSTDDALDSLRAGRDVAIIANFEFAELLWILLVRSELDQYLHHTYGGTLTDYRLLYRDGTCPNVKSPWT